MIYKEFLENLYSEYVGLLLLEIINLKQKVMDLEGKLQYKK